VGDSQVFSCFGSFRVLRGILCDLCGLRLFFFVRLKDQLYNRKVRKEFRTERKETQLKSGDIPDGGRAVGATF
jgi:hypothetical protein